MGQVTPGFKPDAQPGAAPASGSAAAGSGYRGRFAPSPTGELHLGSLLVALASWLRARQCGGTWLVRIEDVDREREVPGSARRILASLAAFGMQSDEPVLYQSRRGDAYRQALHTLVSAGLAFPCHCSRTQVAARGGHRGRCRPPRRTADTDAGAEPPQPGPAWRLLAPDRSIGFLDAIQGHLQQNLQREVGDFVLKRRDGLWAYQLAVVVDDAAQGITEVVRGADLLDSTPRQILLQQLLGLATPAYAHLPLLLDDDGAKLSKQSRSLPVDPAEPLPAMRHALRLLGIAPAHLALPGATPERLLAAALPVFAMDKIMPVRSLCSATWATGYKG